MYLSIVCYQLKINYWTIITSFIIILYVIRIFKKYIVYSSISEKGYLDLLIYSHKNKYPFNQSIMESAKNGHLDCFEYAFKNGLYTDGSFTNHVLCLINTIDYIAKMDD